MRVLGKEDVEMVNVVRLQEALKERSISYEDAARALGVDRATFYRRLSSKGSKFTVDEVGKLSALLGLTSKAMQDIFFDRELA